MLYADLTPELERQLVARYQTGDRTAAQVLVETFERMLWHSLRRFAGLVQDERDARQTLRAYILEAALRFDASTSKRLFTYVKEYAGGKFINDVTHDTTIVVKRTAFRKARAMQRASQRDGSEIPALVGLRLRLRESASLDQPINSRQHTLHDILTSDTADDIGNRHANQRRGEIVTQLLRSLSEQESIAVQAYYLSPEERSLRAIGAELGVSGETVHQRLKRAMFKLRRAVRSVMTEDDAALWGGRREPPRETQDPGVARIAARRDTTAAVLRAVHRLGEVSVVDVVASLRGTVGTRGTQDALYALTNRGLLLRLTDPVDNRLYRFRLSDAGRAEIARLDGTRPTTRTPEAA